MAAAARIALATAQESPLMTGGSTLAPAGGAVAFVYQHNTTIQASVYVGETGATMFAQPLLADANGLLPGWVAGGQDLDIVATFAGQTLTQQIEPVIASNAGATAGVALVDAPTGVTATDTAAWHAARDLAGVGGTVQGRPGTYTVSGLNATRAGQRWLVPAGCTIITASGTNAPIITVTAAVVLEGPGTLDGNGSVNTGSSTLGIWLSNGSTGSIVRNLTVQNTFQPGIYSYVGNVTIQGNTVLNTILGPAIYAQPGTLADLPDIRVLDNTVDKSSQNPATAQGYGIQIHGGPAGSTFTATTTNASTTLSAVSSFTNLAVGLAISHANIPVGATIASLNPGAGTLTMTLPAIAAGTGITISVNYSLRGLVVSRNKVKLPLSPTTTALAIECWGGTPGAIVSENRVSGGQMGISLDRSDNGTVIGNSAENYTQQGIEIANCTGVTVNGNTIDGSVRGGGGITLDGLLTPTTKTTVVGNAITRVTNVGGLSGKAIFVISNGDHCTIVGNAVTVNSGLNTAGVYVQNSPSTAVLCNMLYCYSSVANDAIVFEGSSSGGGVVLGNVIEGWPRNAVSVFAGSVQTIDRIILGPNVLNNNGGIFGAVGSAVVGNLCRFTYTEQSQAGPAVSNITVSASPFTYTNTDHNPELVYITGGTVSAVAKNAINIFTASPCSVHLEPGDSIVVTYTAAPSMRKDVL